MKRRKKPGRRKWWLRPTSTHPYAVLKRKAWGTFALWIKNRDGWRCITCGIRKPKASSMHAGHYITRTRLATLFSEKNVSAQCRECNYSMYHGRIHSLFAERLIERYGPNIIAELNAIPRKLKFTRDELLAIIKKYS